MDEKLLHWMTTSFHGTAEDCVLTHSSSLPVMQAMNGTLKQESRKIPSLGDDVAFEVCCILK